MLMLLRCFYAGAEAWPILPLPIDKPRGRFQVPGYILRRLSKRSEKQALGDLLEIVVELGILSYAAG